MNEQPEAQTVRRAIPNELAAEDERRRFEEAHFASREWQRLAFLRWLYRQGLLTEWPEQVV